MSRMHKYSAIALTALIIGTLTAGCSTTADESPVIEEPEVTRVEHDTYKPIADQIDDVGLYDEVPFAEAYYWEMATRVCEARNEGVSHAETMHILNDMMAMKRSKEILTTFTDVLYANECPEHRL